MRITKAGKQHRADVNIQQQGAYTIDARTHLLSVFRNALAMMRVWGGPWEGKEAMELRRAIGNYLERMGGSV